MATQPKKPARAVTAPPAEPEQTPEKAAGEPGHPFMSEGVRGELETWGRAVDPATGGVFDLDKDTGKVTFTDRSGNVVDL